MIKGQDEKFQAIASGLTWAERNFFGDFSAEQKPNVGVHALFRPNLGVVSSARCMNSGRAVTPFDLDFCDLHAAKPIWRLRGRAPTTFRGLACPNTVSFSSPFECEMNGLKGHGKGLNFFELPQLKAPNSAEAKRRPSHLH